MLTEQCSTWICAVFVAVLLSLHPWAAIGAAGGCFFFMAYPPKKTTYLARMALMVFSWMLGYASGVFFYPDGPPYDPSAMLPAVALSALAVVLGLAVVKMMERGGPLPLWVDGILDRIPVLKRKGDDNGL